MEYRILNIEYSMLNVEVKTRLKAECLQIGVALGFRLLAVLRAA